MAAKKSETAEKKSIEITDNVIKKVAATARLKLSAKEAKEMKKDLNAVLLAFKDLDKLNVEKTRPSFHPMPIADVFREDEKEEPIGQEKALSNTKHKEKGYFKGPKAV